MSNGARVIVTSSSDEKLEQARALGASETINYRTVPNNDIRLDYVMGGQGDPVILLHDQGKRILSIRLD